MQIGTRMLGRSEAGGSGSGDAPGPGERGVVRQPGADGTLLAVVPIPGTGTSLAIVGYPVTAPGSDALPSGHRPGGPVLAGTVPAGPVPGDIAGRPAGSAPGCCLTTISGGSGWTAPRSR